MEEVNAEEDRAVKDVWVMVKLIFIRSMDYRRVVYVVYIYTCYSCARSFDARTEELDYQNTAVCVLSCFFFFETPFGEKTRQSEINKSSGEGPALAFLPTPAKKKGGGLCGGSFGALRINLTAQLRRI
jgi:hypothetical protein